MNANKDNITPRKKAGNLLILILMINVMIAMTPKKLVSLKQIAAPASIPLIIIFELVSDFFNA